MPSFVQVNLTSKPRDGEVCHGCDQVNVEKGANRKKARAVYIEQEAMSVVHDYIIKLLLLNCLNFTDIILDCFGPNIKWYCIGHNGPVFKFRARQIWGERTIYDAKTVRCHSESARQCAFLSLKQKQVYQC